jgi:hypothetical protein
VDSVSLGDHRGSPPADIHATPQHLEVVAVYFRNSNRRDSQTLTQHLHLNRAQKSVVEDVLSWSERIQGIQGFAGTGKTTTLSVVRVTAETQEYESRD